MIKLRVIDGGKERRGVVSETKLFSAYSLIDNFRGYDCVRLNWVYLGRKFPVGRFEKLIDGYKQIDERMRSYFEEYVNELFTEEEVEKLRGFVSAAVGVDVHAVEQELPISCIFVPMPYRNLKAGGPRGFFDPAVPEGSKMPFRTCGYFDLSKCPPSVSMSPDTLENGIAFLKDVLDRLGIEARACRCSLREVIENSYDESGFFVDKGKNRDERMQERSDFFKLDSNPPKNP